MPHKPQLDGLRFLAFLAVFYFHARPSRNHWGPEGVRVFFTLSGFLITRILIQGQTGDLRGDLKRFYIRRTLRIFPLYYAVVAWLWAEGGLSGIGWYLTYTYNIRSFLLRSWAGPVGHFWTLCVEEQFYLLYPPALLLTPSRFRPALIVGLLLGSKAFQAYAHARLSIPWSGFLLPYCGEFLLWGCLAALVELRIKPGTWEGPIALALGVALVATCPGRPDGQLGLPATLGLLSGFGLGSALVVFGLWRTESPWIVAPLAWRPVAYLGKISYGLYVYHLLVIERDWQRYLPDGYFLNNSTGELLGTIAVAAASWRFFEGPINRLKDRLTTPPGPTPASAAGPGPDSGAERGPDREGGHISPAGPPHDPA
jgi:peptidoglycan/LPS O-acetylase OafA/YrhL